VKRFVSHETGQQRARVERGTLRIGDAYHVKRRLVRSTILRAAGNEAGQPSTPLGHAFDEPGQQLERRTFHLLKLDSWRRTARLESSGCRKTLVAATSEEPARFRGQTNQPLASVQMGFA
jgi:hypothetical protein